jgi:prolyl-tRNA editing enzyme YbaK/EbsC (Cys-tRNA(Pro) deacylase)
LIVILADARIHMKRLDRHSGARQNPPEAPLVVILAHARIHLERLDRHSGARQNPFSL